MDRRRTLDVIKAARELGDYDEFPVLVESIDPQVHLSRNTLPQPFHLTCSLDTLLVQMTGEARVDFASGNVRSHRMVPGDHVYIPAGMPHRIVPVQESVHVRYKARSAGYEAVSWFCPVCAAELDTAAWDTAQALSQQAQWDACVRFNADEKRRTCARCSAVHPPIDLTPFNWPDVAAVLRSA